MFRRALRVSILFILLACPVSAKYLHSEKEYQDYWCSKEGGQTEYAVMGGRVDCLLPEYAIEFDFAKKVYEGIGQAYFYSSETGKKPAVVLIIENPIKEDVYLKKLEQVSKAYGLKYWIITPEEIK